MQVIVYRSAKFFYEKRMPQPSLKKKPESKILTGFRIHPELKALAMVAADMENRSFSNFLENLIRQDLTAKKLTPPKRGK